MRRSAIKGMFFGALSVFLILGLVPAASAVPTLTLFDGTTTVIVADGSGLDSSPIAGVVEYNNSIGNFFVNVTTGISSPVFAPGSMDLNSIDVTSTGGQLTITLSDTFNSLPVGLRGVNFAVGGTIVGGNIDFAVFTQAPGITLIGSSGPFAGLPFDGSFSGSFNNPGVFTLFETAHMTFDGFGTTSFDAFVQVPEPGILMLLGAGLAGLGLFRVRGKKS